MSKIDFKQSITFEHRIKGAKILAGNPLLMYLFAFLLIMTTNTLPGMVNGRSAILTVLFLIECLLIILLVWIETSLDRDLLGRLILWDMVLALSYCLVTLNSGITSFYGLLLVCLFAVTPFLIALLQKALLLDNYLKALVNAMVVVSIVSLTLWVAGPVLGLIKLNCSIVNSWGGNGLTWYTDGYFNLQYVPQWQNLPMGIGLFRNTSFFAEAPMYSYILCCVLLIELFIVEKRRYVVVFILSLTVLTTFSSTGLIFLLGIALIGILRKFAKKKGRAKVLLMLVSILLFLIGSCFAFLVLDNKMQTTSGSTRLDDFAAGFKAWSQSPLFGYGFANTDIIKNYMSSFRADNLGFSNSLFQTLVMGGIIWLIPYLVGFIGYFKSSHAVKFAGVLFLFLWIVTVVSNLPITFFMLGLGIVKIIIPDNLGESQQRAN